MCAFGQQALLTNLHIHIRRGFPTAKTMKDPQTLRGFDQRQILELDDPMREIRRSIWIGQ
jgi:hypothetical protein